MAVSSVHIRGGGDLILICDIFFINSIFNDLMAVWFVLGRYHVLRTVKLSTMYSSMSRKGYRKIVKFVLVFPITLIFMERFEAKVSVF